MANQCKQIFCMNISKDVKCCKCGTWLCRCCDIRVNKKTYCFDCLVYYGLMYDFIEPQKKVVKNEDKVPV